MTTESAIRMPGSSGRWPNSGRGAVPNRSGSAPPSMEGSFLAVDNLLSQPGSGHRVNLPSFHGSVQNLGFEEHVTTDPSCLAYYSSKLNLNPRLSPPLNPIENQFLRDHISRFRSNWGSGNINGPIHLSQGTLSTHKEVSEEDSSPRQSVQNVSDRTNRFLFGQDIGHLLGGQQGSGDSRQDDTCRDTNPQHRRSSSSTCETTTAGENDYLSEISDDVKCSVGKDNAASSSGADSSAVNDCTSNHQKKAASTGSEKNPDVSNITSKMKNTSISKTMSLDYRKPRGQKQGNHFHSVLPEKQLNQQQNNGARIQGVQIGSYGVNDAFVRPGQFLHGSPSKFSGDGQPVLHSSGFTPPPYASNPAAYMASPNSVYNMQSPGVYSPQYGLGACTLTPNIVSQFIPGYPTHSAIPFVLSPNFIPQPGTTPGIGNFAHGAEMQYPDKLYGPIGQPSFVDPLYMQYYQQPPGQSYGMPGQIGQLTPRVVASRCQNNVWESQKDESKVHRQISGPGDQNPVKMGMMGPKYYGMQPMVHYPSAQIGTPVSPGAVQLVEPYSGWQAQRGLEGASGPRLCNFLEEFKAGRGRRFELSDIAGHIVEFSADQHGSRFIQQKLENCSAEEKASVFKEVLPHACKLMTDVFGNYVIQKFFEYGNSTQRKELADQLTGQVLPLSLQMYGCRVIQKALDVIEPDQKARLVRELDGQVMRCVRDQNGNHVIQKCIENVPTDKIGFIISAFRGQVASLSMHPYGCRVIQRVLEHCTYEDQCRFIIDEILESVCVLSKDQYGNYVTQHVLERWTPEERERIVRKLSGHIVQLSQHKFASNVIEKCLEYGGPIERDLIVKEIEGHDGGNDNLLTMVKDQYGNYVVQKVFGTCTDDQRATLLGRIRMHAPALKKYTYGKHIVTRLEQLFGEESQAS